MMLRLQPNGMKIAYSLVLCALLRHTLSTAPFLLTEIFNIKALFFHFYKMQLWMIG